MVRRRSISIFHFTSTNNMAVTLNESAPQLMPNSETPEHLHLSHFEDNDTFVEVLQLLTNEMHTNPASTRSSMRDLVYQKFPYDENGRFVLDFAECSALDHFFWQTGETTHWLGAFGYPTNNTHTGMFTFRFDNTSV